MSNENDLNLLAAIAKGDQQAMETFYRQYSSVVYQFAFKSLQNGPDSAEVMNEVMMEVWRKAGTFKGGSKVRTWLLAVTHNKAVDAVRRNARHYGGEELDEAEQVAPQCRLEDSMTTARDAKLVQHCLKRLKSIHRQVVYLAFFEGLPYPEITRILNIPHGTVKTRMLHAKKLLQQCLAGLAFEDTSEQGFSASTQPAEA